jgi:hypothetical protein
MGNREDDNFLGEIVENFDARLLSVPPGTEPVVAFIFIFRSSSKRLIKFERSVAKDLSENIHSAITSLDVSDERPEVIARLKDKKYLREHPEFADHPLVKFMASKAPDFPPEVTVASREDYVEFVHVNAYPDIFKFDVNFLDGSCSRISIPVPLVWTFSEQLDLALRGMV